MLNGKRLQDIIFKADNDKEQIFLLLLITPTTLIMAIICFFFIPIIGPFYSLNENIFIALIAIILLLAFAIFFFYVGLLGIKQIYEIINERKK